MKEENELLIRFNSISDGRGELVALECGRQIPFTVRRVYYMYEVPAGCSRGYHAHLQLNQLCIALHGSVKMILDDGVERREVLLDHPTKAVRIGPGVWREMHDFSSDCVLMVLADQAYDESDYIRDYDRFLASVNLRVASQ